MPTSFDELDNDLPSINTVPEEVELHVDVFTPVVQNRILREGDGGLVVHHQCWWVSFHGQLASSRRSHTTWHAAVAVVRTLPRT